MIFRLITVFRSLVLVLCPLFSARCVGLRIKCSWVPFELNFRRRSRHDRICLRPFEFPFLRVIVNVVTSLFNPLGGCPLFSPCAFVRFFTFVLVLQFSRLLRFRVRGERRHGGAILRIIMEVLSGALYCVCPVDPCTAPGRVHIPGELRLCLLDCTAHGTVHCPLFPQFTVRESARV